MFGLLFTILLFFISNFYTNVYLLSISVGVFLDEIGFILIKGKTHEDNYSPKSFMIIMLFILLLFVKPLNRIFHLLLILQLYRHYL